MAVSTLDSKLALILVDLQKGVVALPTAHSAKEVVQRAAAIAEAFRSRGLPVVLVNVAGTAPGRTEQVRSHAELPAGWADIVPELNQRQEDHAITKRTWGAFTNTDLGMHLTALGITHVVIGGIATSIGVESTARQAYERGLNVTLAIDAMTDVNAEAHINSITRIFPRLGETGTTEEIVDALRGTNP